jgi:hypothetical protein
VRIPRVGIPERGMKLFLNTLLTTEWVVAEYTNKAKRRLLHVLVLRHRRMGLNDYPLRASCYRSSIGRAAVL